MGAIGTNSRGATAPSTISENKEQSLIFNPIFSNKVDEYTANFTPEMFLGDINNFWTGTASSLIDNADMNAPETIEIEGYTFKQLGNPFTTVEQTGKTTGKDVILLTYQATEKGANSEYKLLHVGIRVWRTKAGKTKSEIIRDGFTNRTRFL